MLAIVAKFNQHHQDLGPDDARQDGDDAEVPELVRVKPLLPANLDDEQQAEDEAQRCHQAVGGETEVAKVKETGKHVCILDAKGWGWLQRVLGYAVVDPNPTLRGRQQPPHTNKRNSAKKRYRIFCKDL